MISLWVVRPISELTRGNAIIQKLVRGSTHQLPAGNISCVELVALILTGFDTRMLKKVITTILRFLVPMPFCATLLCFLL
eukprot:m.192547 g.192547  ORF g.192547 m.192547 type:complete len:80 (+) comp14857_c0_seq4:307-546(+)